MSASSSRFGTVPLGIQFARGCAPVVEGLETEIEEVEHAIFAGSDDLTERIYLLKTELNELYRALHPLIVPLEAIERGIGGLLLPCVALFAWFRRGGYVQSS